MLLEKNTKLVFIGDSVTDCGRARPVGEGLFGAIGTGYAGYVNALLDATVPKRKIRVVNMGSSGNTVRSRASYAGRAGVAATIAITGKQSPATMLRCEEKRKS